MNVMRAVLAALVASTLIACVPDIEETVPEDEPPGAEEDDPDEPHREAVLAAIDLGRGPLAEAAVALEEAIDADDTATSIAAVRRAVTLLTASAQLRDAAAASDDDTATPFLPSSDPEDGEDLLNRVVAAARGAGDHGSRLAAVLHDPVVGDLTAWQQDPDLVVDAIDAAAAAASEEAIDDLLGEVPRALAWAMVAADAGELDATQQMADRAAAHLAVALAALDQVRDDLAET